MEDLFACLLSFVFIYVGCKSLFGARSAEESLGVPAWYSLDFWTKLHVTDELKTEASPLKAPLKAPLKGILKSP